jgi:sterol desaturase/sphingolipid hydroxylase (fatty acid hydroxylase superfamily)
MRGALAWVSWWAVMGGSIGATLVLSHGGAPSAGLVGAVTIANTAGIAVAEQLLPRTRGFDLLRDRQSWNDMLHGVLFQYGGRPLAQALAATAVVWLGARAGGLASHWPHRAPLLVQGVLGVGLWGLASYWFHRSLHAFRGLWGFHAIHHDTRQMHLLKSGRIHVGEEFLQYLWVPLPFLLLGAGPAVLAWVALWNVFAGNLQHSNLDQRFPFLLHYLLPTPQNHWLHHAEARHLQDSNYGDLPVWDLIFRTYRHPEHHPVESLGISGDPVPPGFLRQVLYPFRELLGSRPEPVRERP